MKRNARKTHSETKETTSPKGGAVELHAHSTSADKGENSLDIPLIRKDAAQLDRNFSKLQSLLEKLGTSKKEGAIKLSRELTTRSPGALRLLLNIAQYDDDGFAKFCEKAKLRPATIAKLRKLHKRAVDHRVFIEAAATESAADTKSAVRKLVSLIRQGSELGFEIAALAERAKFGEDVMEELRRMLVSDVPRQVAVQMLAMGVEELREQIQSWKLPRSEQLGLLKWRTQMATLERFALAAFLRFKGSSFAWTHTWASGSLRMRDNYPMVDFRIAANSSVKLEGSAELDDMFRLVSSLLERLTGIVEHFAPLRNQLAPSFGLEMRKAMVRTVKVVQDLGAVLKKLDIINGQSS